MKNSRILILMLSASLAILYNCTGNQDEKAAATHDKSGNLFIGWETVDITPDENVLIAGQHHARVSEGVMDPVTATVLAFESVEEGSSEKAILISCDLVSISDGTRDGEQNNLRTTLRRIITGKIPGIAPENIILNATHTHTAPYCDIVDRDAYGVELDVMAPDEYLKFVAGRIADAAERAWNSREPGGVSYGLGQAVVGHNRLQVSLSGESLMYGSTNRPEFSHIEGYEDHSVNLLYTWDAEDHLTGIVINVACPSQVTESLFEVSADYWHDTRVEIRRRLGENIFILPQCSAAGDQSPHIMVGERAEARMQRLIFPDSIETGDRTIGLRKQIAIRIADAVTSVLPYMKDHIERDPVFEHHMKEVELSRRLISMEDVNNAMEEAEKYEKQYEEMLLDIQENPEIKQEPRWYHDITRTYTFVIRGQSVKERYELEKIQPQLPVEVHVLRIGDVVMATNPFELYLDYGMRIKARSPALQTFIVQLAGSGSYLPTDRSIAGGAYGAVPASTLIGPEGGQELVEKTLEMINNIMEL